MRSKIGLTIAALAFVGLAAAVFAQQPQGQPGGGRGRGGPPGGFGGFGGGGGTQSRMSLLRIAEIRKELELADEQIAEIEKIDTELREKYPFGGGRGGPPGGGGPGGGQDGGRRGRPQGQGQGTSIAPAEWFFVVAQQPPEQGQGRGRGGFGGFQPPSPEEQARMEQQRLERDREAKAKLADVLLPHQIKRLNEIFVQVAGVGALQDEDVAKELGISDAQKAKLAEVRTANGTAMREQMQAMFQGGGGGGGNEADRDAIRTKMEGIRKEADAKLLAVLSADQQAKFEAMKGKAFAMPENAGRGGPGGPGGRGRGQGGTPGGGRPQND